jgi:hypothetical protein
MDVKNGLVVVHRQPMTGYTERAWAGKKLSRIKEKCRITI